ncbi:MAG: ABC transporter permease [Clostridia bacterium]|nr:ABC transporter permease [Clostridia bacterium]
MKTLLILIKRNTKIFFKDRGMFFTSLITPAILLVLYTTFLKGVYKDTFISNLPEGITFAENIIDSLVASQLISSILAVSCVTVAFCSNFLMVMDKYNGTVKDLTIAPVRPSVLASGYYVANLISTLIICYVAYGISMGYVMLIGSYITLSDAICLFLDVTLLALFGASLSSVINFFLSTQGQISAVGTIISAGYGFLCGAYMPISSFGDGLQKVLLFSPGTYGTALVRTHSLNGVLTELEKSGVPSDVVTSFRDALDCNLYIFGESVSTSVMYLILGGTVSLLVIAYILLNVFKKSKA